MFRGSFVSSFGRPGPLSALFADHRTLNSEEEDAEDYPLPLTLKSKKRSEPSFPSVPTTNGA